MFLPGAILDPGAHWSYQAGVADVWMEVEHYTVGRNSIGLIRDQGLAAFLVRDEGVYQFAPSDAVCFTQCEWNRRATATEVESLDGTISDAQLNHFAYLTLWKLSTHGIPPDFYDGPRLELGYPFRGVTGHRHLVHRACDQHTDGFDRWVWDRMMAGGTPTHTGGNPGMYHMVTNALAGPITWKVDGLQIIGQCDYNGPRGALAIHQEAWDALEKHGIPIVNGEVAKTDGAKPLKEYVFSYSNGGWMPTAAGATPAPATGGATADQVTAIVAKSEERILADVNKPRRIV